MGSREPGRPSRRSPPSASATGPRLGGSVPDVGLPSGTDQGGPAVHHQDVAGDVALLLGPRQGLGWGTGAAAISVSRDPIRRHPAKRARPRSVRRSRYCHFSSPRRIPHPGGRTWTGGVEAGHGRRHALAERPGGDSARHPFPRPSPPSPGRLQVPHDAAPARPPRAPSRRRRGQVGSRVRATQTGQRFRAPIQALLGIR
jgi:hypothetical protein